MAEEDEVDIVSIFEEDVIESKLDNPAYTEIGCGVHGDPLLPPVAPEMWLLEGNTVGKLNANSKCITHDSNEPNSLPDQKLPVLKNRKQPWSPQERSLFEKGMTLYGRRWTKISRLIGSRTTLQVKNYATHYFKMLVKSESRSTAKEDNLKMVGHSAESSWDTRICNKLPETNSREVVTRMHIDDGDPEGEDVDVVVDILGDDRRISGSHVESPPASVRSDSINDVNRCYQRMLGSSVENCVLSESNGQAELMNTLNASTQQVVEFCTEDRLSSINLPAADSNLNVSVQSSSVDSQHVDTTSVNMSCLPKVVDDEQEKDSGVLDDSHQMFLCDPPTQEIVIDRNLVTDEEKDFHREFFEGRFPKTPERYMKIRNYIVDMWEKNKPKYLNKTCVRSGLRNCGDVNSIGRIHAYLEMRGAINFGCDQAVYNRPASFSTASVKTNRVAITGNLKEIVGSRKRKSPFDSLLPILEGGQGGFTIEHTDAGDKVVSCPDTKTVIKPRANPFRLIPCATFSPESDAPYSVILHAEAVVIMDIHSHTSNTEVIGLLGGFYSVASRQLEVVIAKPCHSLSTGRQCEMDPVSQTEASQSLEALGLAVVGWYHSHPTFLPHPSLRDLETQAKYQEWFGQHRNPFVAVIISPYSGPLVSKILCMIVGEATQDGLQRQPFQLTTAFSGASFRTEHCLTGIATLLQDFVVETTAVAMDTAFAVKPEYTLLKKMLASVESHLVKAEVFAYEGFLENLSQLMRGKDTLLTSHRNGEV